ncbi:hypothetical protein [Glaciibacter superstes]|uniref:hypothetical protein n=1 Tax=Glaciibacter superstes TaxID=501023 RepID=UPI0003B641EE|nr:hypothetical protein [Glaciibacter superstes]
MSDPTKVRNQPALNRGTGNTWLVIGGIITLLSIIFFAFGLNLHPVGVALAGLLAVVALYAGMLIARFTIRPEPLRLRTLAVLLLAISVIALVCLGILAWTEWGAL